MNTKVRGSLISKMPLSRGIGMNEALVLLCVRCTILLLATNNKYAEAVFVWTAPPPAWNQTVQGTLNIQTAVVEVLNGSVNYHLRWNYTLLDGQSISLVTFAVFDGTGQIDDIGFSVSGSVTIFDRNDYRIRFSTESTSEFSALIISTVTERENATFQCKIALSEGTSWAYNARIFITAPSEISHISANRTVNQNDRVDLNCTATGLPTPTIFWTRLSDNSNVSMPLNITGRKDQGGYRCTAYNGIGDLDTADVFIAVQKFSPESSNLTSSLIDNIVNVSEVFNITCSTEANPPAEFRFYRDDMSLFNATTGSNVAVHSTSVNESRSSVIYSCIPFNEFGDGPIGTITITVNFAPEIVNAPSDEEVVEGNSLNLFCNATGSPQPDITWKKEGESGVLSSSETLKLTNLNSEDNGAVYICKVNNSLGSDEANATITVFFAPNVTLRQCPTVVNESNAATLYCNATGNPVPSIKWIRRNTGEVTVVSNNSALVFEAINPNESGLYQCIANNSIGNDSKNCAVDVQYPPKIVKPTSSEKSELLSSSITVECVAEGSPGPRYVWTNVADGTETHGRNLTIEKVNFHDGRNYTYTCTATNDLGYDNRTASIEITSNRIRVQFIITMVNEKKAVFDNSKEDEIKNGLEQQVNTKFRNDSKYNRITDIYLRSGSIIVSFVILFKSPVTLSEGLAPLSAAVESGTLGPYTVKDLRAIEDVSPTTIPSDSPTSAGSTTAPVKPVDKTTSSREDGPPWGIIGGAIGAVVVVVIIVILVACWVHKKRKCRKDTKIHNSESEVLQGQNDIEDGVHAKVNGGYADAGPPSANGTNRFVQPQPEQQQQQAAAAPPDYAVVDKSKKKNKDSNKGNENIPDYAVVEKSKKKKNKKAEAEVEDRKKDTDKKTADPSTHDYAVVNKSKKKKKEEDENAYATVDKSKKSKKKPKAPGEVLYADLDDFKPVQAPSMPTVSTSPEPLAPLKRPPSYQATEYADITQFLKGNATLPEGQSTEMEPTYANAGGGQEAAKKENANTGGEGGGGDTEHKETPM